VYVIHNISPIIFAYDDNDFPATAFLYVRHIEMHASNSTEPITAFIPNSFVEAARHVTTRHKTLLLSFGFFIDSIIVFYQTAGVSATITIVNSLIRHMRYHLVLINQNNKLCIYLCRSNFRNTVHEVCTKCQ
jgi:hypothetical protein